MRIKASIYSIPSNHARSVKSELDKLSASASDGNLVGLSYAATSLRHRNIIGRAGNHVDNDKAIGALFRAAVALLAVD